MLLEFSITLGFVVTFQQLTMRIRDRLGASLANMTGLNVEGSLAEDTCTVLLLDH